MWHRYLVPLILLPYVIRVVFLNSNPGWTYGDHVGIMFMLMASSFGGYSIYTACAERQIKRRSHTQEVALPLFWFDHIIPFHPMWNLIYLLISYLAFVLALMTHESQVEIIRLCATTFVLVIAHCGFWHVIPTTVNPRLVRYSGHQGSLSNVIGINAFPSLYCSMSTTLTCTLINNGTFGWWPTFIPLITCAACMGAKQHAFLDVIIGVIVGADFYLLMLH